MGTVAKLGRIGVRVAMAATGSAAQVLRRPLVTGSQSFGVSPVRVWREPEGDVTNAPGSLRSPAVRVATDDGVELFAEVDELPKPDAQGLTVVFTHGYLENRHYWHYQRLAMRGYVRMVFWDLRGHGNSPQGATRPVTIERLADDLLLVLERLAPDGPIILVGHSLGGMVTMALARYHPQVFTDRVQGVGFVSTSARMDDYDIGLWQVGEVLWRHVPGGIQRMLDRPGMDRHVERVRRWTGRLEAEAIKEIAFATRVDDEILQLTTDMFADAEFASVGDLLTLFSSHDVTAALSVMAALEAAVITGDSDPILAVAHSRTIARALPKALFSVVPRGGHLVSLEHPDIVNPHLFGLVKRVRYRIALDQFTRQEPPA